MRPGPHGMNFRGTPHKSTDRANPFPDVTNLFCRIPLHYITLCVRDCSPWRPDAESVRSFAKIGSRHTFLGLQDGPRTQPKIGMLSGSTSTSRINSTSMDVLTSTRRENPSRGVLLRSCELTIEVALDTLQRSGNVRPVLFRLCNYRTGTSS